jgi:hypothetical protein
MGSANDDVGNCGSDADLDARITLLSEFALEELVQLGIEYAICESKTCQRVVSLIKSSI